MAPTSPRRGGHLASVVLLLSAALVCALAALAGPATAAAHDARRAHRAVTHVFGWSSSELRTAPGATRAFTMRLGSRGGVAGRPVVIQRQAVGAHGWATAARGTTDSQGRVVLRWRAPAQATRVYLRVRVPATRHARALTSGQRLALVLTGGGGTTNPGTPTDPGDTDTDPADPRLTQVLDLLNKARATGRTCGSEHFDAAPVLRLDKRLDRASGDYATRMATEDFFSHESPDGDDPGDRITAAGYTWHAWGENIAAGQPTPEDVVQAWLASPGHCENLMNPGFVDLGVGVASDPDSTYGIYWVTDFGHP